MYDNRKRRKLLVRPDESSKEIAISSVFTQKKFYCVFDGITKAYILWAIKICNNYCSMLSRPTEWCHWEEKRLYTRTWQMLHDNVAKATKKFIYALGNIVACIFSWSNPIGLSLIPIATASFSRFSLLNSKRCEKMFRWFHWIETTVFFPRRYPSIFWWSGKNV